MARTVSIGTQDFEKMIQRNCFYVDKTGFIKEWWESEDEVTLITRPRRFGKTLNMSMLNCFFSNKYADRGELFEKLEIWKDGKYREIQGTYPVIFLSFAGVKGNTFELSKKQIYDKIIELYESNRFLLKSDCMSDTEKARYISFLEKPLEYDTFRNKICHVIRRLKETNQNIVVKDIESGKKICVSLREILYFEKEKGSPYMNIVCNKETIRTRESLTQFDEYLKDNGFVKINRGCVINMKYVQSFDTSEVEIQMVRENKILHISRRNQREVREALAVYKSMGGY